MFTVCPSCAKQFHIYAEHIAAAGGQVRCGFCSHQFNALERLSDEPFPETVSPDPLSNQAVAQGSEKAIEQIAEEPLSVKQEPQFEIAPEAEDDAAMSAVSEDVLIADNSIENQEELQTAIDEIGVKTTEEEVRLNPELESALQIDPLAAEPEEQLPEFKAAPNFATQVEEHEYAVAATEPLPAEAELAAAKVEPAETQHYHFPEPEELLAPTLVKKSLGWRVFWSMMTLLGLLCITIQLVWFNRDWVLAQYPQLLPYAKQACRQLQCDLIRQRDVNAIRLINRDVRLHPRFRDALLVNATMVNELETRQPYPRVQLTLFDTDGGLLGYRDFVPDDYLDSSIDLDLGMPINAPVHFVLEVTGPTVGAVSFEFRFL